jgi:hypothetical protein
MSMPTSTFQALSYADRIRQVQGSERSSPLASTPVSTSLPKQESGNGDVVKGKEAANTDESVCWQEVVGRNKKDATVDQVKTPSLSEKGSSNRKDETIDRARNQSSIGDEPDLSGPNNSVEGNENVQPKTTWAGLAPSKLPPPALASRTITSPPVEPSHELSNTSLRRFGADGTSKTSEERVSIGSASGPAAARIPLVNIWQARKEKMSMSTPTNALASSSSGVKSVFSSMAAEPLSKLVSKSDGAEDPSASISTTSKNGPIDTKNPNKTSNKGLQKLIARKVTHAIPNLTDNTAWPDVALAATTSSKSSATPTTNKPDTTMADDVEVQLNAPSVPS